MKMALKQKLIWGVQLWLVLLCALTLKVHYSTATADDLRWILAPTTLLVEFLGGHRFQFESYAGYMSSDRRFVIAVPCAGVNFLIAAFLMLTLRRWWRGRHEGVSWTMIPVAAVLAYVATLAANTTRIWLALELRALSVDVTGLTSNQVHRLEGIAVYFGFLLLLFVVVERFESGKPLPGVRWLAFPIFIYYAVTLGVPVANGSFRQGSAFWEHSAFVLVLPVLFVAPLAAWHAWRRVNQNRRLLPR